MRWERIILTPSERVRLELTLENRSFSDEFTTVYSLSGKNSAWSTGTATFVTTSTPPGRPSSRLCDNYTAPTTGYLEVLPEEECDYKFNIHTPRACSKKVAPLYECFVPGFSSLSSLAGIRVPPILVPGVWTAYLAVCGPRSVDNQLIAAAASTCPYGAVACLLKDEK